MAEAEPSDKDKSTPSPQRKPHYQNRAGSSYRGRGRANASVSKALHLFGVRDLREILDKKHQEHEQTKAGPPPDPSYNYLKDPSREYTSEQHAHKHHKEYAERTSGDYQPRGHFRGSRGRGRGGTTRENRHSESEKTSYIQNPVNIKVEVLASTGERNCKLDEETKLADIKRIPNYNLKDMRPPPRNESNDTRHPPGNENNSTRYSPRYESSRGRGGFERNDRGRGRGQRGRRGRGRVDRGGGRGGQGRYHPPRNSEGHQPQQPAVPEVPSEENWDTDSPTQDTVVENEGGKQDEENHEEKYTEDQDVIHQEECFEDDGEEYSEENQPHDSLEAGPSDSKVNLEENLVITSSHNEEKRKRTVKFKEEEQKEQVPDQNIHVAKETPKSESNETHEVTNKE